MTDASLDAMSKIRNWAIACLAGGQICRDTDAFNRLVDMFSLMGDRVALGGVDMNTDLTAFLQDDVPLRIAGFDTAIGQLQAGQADLLALFA